MSIGPSFLDALQAAIGAIQKTLGKEHIVLKAEDLLFLPPYSLDLNPIEQLVAKFKHLMRKAEQRTHETTWRKVGQLSKLVSPEESQRDYVTKSWNFLQTRTGSPP